MEVASQHQVQKVPKMLTVDTILEPLSYWVFLNPFTAPTFWFCLPFVAFPFVPFIFMALCFFVATLCVSLQRTRRIKSKKLDWKNEIVVVTGGKRSLLHV
jgi:hypothetical protein